MASWETMLPDTAKALSAPLAKLVKVMGDGCGKLYEPTGIRRKALAEADALVIAEEAKVRMSEIRERAVQRVLDVEERRQRNIESIVGEAAALLPDEVSDQPVAPDWSARFFAECQDVGGEEMRTVWAKLLAGEIARPGAFSPRTLSVLKNLTHAEAQHFNTLCKYSFRGAFRDAYPFVKQFAKDEWDKLGISFSTLERLSDAGLVTHYWTGDSLGLRIQTAALFRTPTRAFEVKAKAPGQDRISIGTTALTAAGEELAQVCEWDVPAERVAALLASLTPFEVREVEVEERHGRWDIKPSTT